VVHIKKIEREDLDSLFALDQQCFRPGIAYSKSDLRIFLRRSEDLAFAAKDSAGMLLGFVIAEAYMEKGRRVGHIVTIDVDPERRREGIGERLMQVLLRKLLDIEIGIVRLEVAVDNVAAQRFYLRFGFAETGRISGFYLGTLDALVMEKDIRKDNAR
jgi:[ribosomal protein S18]-alanine N-acetyltransferase